MTAGTWLNLFICFSLHGFDGSLFFYVKESYFSFGIHVSTWHLSMFDTFNCHGLLTTLYMHFFFFFAMNLIFSLHAAAFSFF